MTKHSKPVCLSALLFAAMTAREPISAETAPTTFDVWATSDLVRVFEDGFARPDKSPAGLQLFGLRQETLSAQCVIEAHADLKAVSVAVTPLKQADGSATIRPENISWSFVGSIHIEQNTPKLRKSDLLRAAPAWFPDFLTEERSCACTKDSLKAVYLTICIPRDAEPGEYHADVQVTADDVRASVPLKLTVYPLQLPDERHLMVTEWYSTHAFQQFHGIDSTDSERFFAVLRTYAENMAQHRQNVFRVSLELIRSTRGADGRLQFDFSAFDRWAQVFWETGRMDRLETGFVAEFGEGGWSSREIALRDFSVRDEARGQTVRMAGAEFLPEFLPALVEHLRAKGWLEKTLFHICDEPSNHNVMAWREASAFVHRHAPDLRRMDAIETPHCQDQLEVWVPKLDHLTTWQRQYEQAQRQGNELWFYTVGIFQSGSLPNKTADVPLIESRLMHWLNYRYGLTGYLHWGFNAWTDDPINAPGQHRGDGWHVYPKRDGLLNSLRWEQMRNGIQDYECLWLLENKISQMRGTLSPRVADVIQPSERGVEIAAQVVRSYGDYTREPAVLYAARRQVIAELLDLDVSPRVILQTNPPEHTAVFRNCAIDVHGWCEPGTKIAINGSEIPVASDGLFLEQLSASANGKITVEAVGDKGHKTMVRAFEMKD